MSLKIRNRFITTCALFLALMLGSQGVFAQNSPVHRDPIADSLRDLQRKYLNAEKVDSGLAYNAELIRYYQSIGNDYEFVRENVNRAEVLRAIGGFGEALSLLQSIEELNRSLPLSTVRSTFYNRKAAILHESRQHHPALEAVKESKRIDSIKGYQWRILSNLNIEGALYRDLKQFDKAKSVLNQVLSYAKQANDSDEWASACYNLNALTMRQGDLKSSIHYGRRYLDLSPPRETKITYGDVIYNIGTCYNKLNRFDSAYYFLDSVYGVRMRQMQRIIDDNVNKYEVVNQLERERLQNSILQNEKNQSKLQLMLLVLAVGVAILLIYFANKERIQYKRSHQQQEAYNHELENSLRFKNKLISIVAHDIRNPIASLKGLIHVYNEGLVDEQDLKQMMRGLEASVGNVDLLLENLLNWVRTLSGELEPHVEALNVAEIIHTSINEAQAQLRDKGISVNLDHLQADDTLYTDGNYLAFVLRNVLSNAIKYSEPNSTIFISCHHRSNFDCISIKDTGKGMTEETLKLLKSSSLMRSDKGTGNEKGTGLGLGLSREFLDKIGGLLEIESTFGEGTTVTVCLPKKNEA